MSSNGEDLNSRGAIPEHGYLQALRKAASSAGVLVGNSQFPITARREAKPVSGGGDRAHCLDCRAGGDLEQVDVFPEPRIRMTERADWDG